MQAVRFRCRKRKSFKNIVYNIEVSQLKKDLPVEAVSRCEKFKFKDLGYLCLYWKFEGDEMRNFQGFITIDELKNIIGIDQYSKFCQGKREFILPRRLEGEAAFILKGEK